MAANNGDELSPNGPGSSHGIPACFLQDYPEEFREQVAIDMRQALEDEAVAEGLAPIGGSRDEPGYRRFLEAIRQYRAGGAPLPNLPHGSGAAAGRHQPRQAAGPARLDSARWAIAGQAARDGFGNMPGTWDRPIEVDRPRGAGNRVEEPQNPDMERAIRNSLASAVQRAVSNDMIANGHLEERHRLAFERHIRNSAGTIAESIYKKKYL